MQTPFQKLLSHPSALQATWCHFLIKRAGATRHAMTAWAKMQKLAPTGWPCTVAFIGTCWLAGSCLEVECFRELTERTLTWARQFYRRIPQTVYIFVARSHEASERFVTSGDAKNRVSYDAHGSSRGKARVCVKARSGPKMTGTPKPEPRGRGCRVATLA